MKTYSKLIELPESENIAVALFYLTVPKSYSIVGDVRVEWQKRMFDEGSDALCTARVKRRKT